MQIYRGIARVVLLLGLLTWGSHCRAQGWPGPGPLVPLGIPDLGNDGQGLLDALSLPDDRAEERAQRLAEMEPRLRARLSALPDDPGAHLAAGLYELYGRCDPVAALPLLQRSAALAPDEPDARVHSAICRAAYPVDALADPAGQGAERDLAAALAALDETPDAAVAAPLRAVLARALGSWREREERAAVLRSVVQGLSTARRVTTRSGRCSLALPAGAGAAYRRAGEPYGSGRAQTALAVTRGPVRWEIRRLVGFDPAPLCRAAWVRARLGGEEPAVEWIATEAGSVWLGRAEAGEGREALAAIGDERWVIEAAGPDAGDPEDAFTAQEAMALSLRPLAFRFGEPAAPPSLLASPGTVERYLAAVAERSDWMRLQTIGVSALGRPVTVAVLAHPGSDPAAAQRVFAIARQHGDEPAATAAALHLVHRLALAPRPGDDDLLARAHLAIVPIANPDGAALLKRRNARNADLNRDWGRRQQPETRALHAFQAWVWRPHVFLDLHEMLPDDPSPGYFVQCRQSAHYADPSARERFVKARGAILHRIAAAGCPIHTVPDRQSRALAHMEHARQGIPSFLLETQVYRGDPGRALERRVRFHTEGVLAVMRALAGPLP